MYNIVQLNEKTLTELRDIAREMGIKKADSLEKDKLVYEILDEQASASASKTATSTHPPILTHFLRGLYALAV